ncbi:MAG: ATP-binding protein [Ignavibacteria bacterium]|nr:ATP-binding protein [Ignavibacteria bacterium]
MEGVISTKPDRCRRCYGCIRECPAKAIRVVNGQALIMQDRCIVCGHCVKVCSQQAKGVKSTNTLEFLERIQQGTAVALVAPSFAASWPENYRKLPAALRKLGFSMVMETAFGADLISPLYAEEISNNPAETIISSSCPAVCHYIEKYYPKLVPNLAKIVSPMIAMGRYVKQVYGKEHIIVFFGPCIAKKVEGRDPQVEGVIDEVFTFAELKNILNENALNLDDLEDSNFDPPHANLGKVYPLAGGLLKTADISIDLMEKEILVVEGKSKVIELFEELKDNQINARFIDVLFCEGCISGPGIDSSLNHYSRREKVIEFVQDSINLVDKKVWKSNLYNSRDLQLEREFESRQVYSEYVSDEDLTTILASINKHTDRDRLNCGACGYLTCKEFAISVGKGLAERQMCLPFLIDELQNAYEDLRSTQEQLHSAEKLASIGQLAAGIAHEINNPLGTIMLYASLVKRQVERLEAAGGSGQDLQTIINEANRCKNIVANLLNFARQGKLSLLQFDLFDLLTQMIKKLKPHPAFAGVKVEMHHEANDTSLEADKDQLEQVFLNLLMNAAEAMEGRENRKITIVIEEQHESLVVKVTDTGCGIPKENAGKIFTPFFTTKKIGKGTGLGMAIAYGIIKMHKGDINFESQPEQGTTFFVRLPKVITLSESLIN